MQPKYHDGLAQRITVYLYQDSADLKTLLAKAMENMTGLLRERETLPRKFKKFTEDFLAAQKVSF